LADREPVGGGVSAHGQNPADQNRFEEAVAIDHRIDRQPHLGQGFGQIGGAPPDGSILVKPA
jgi:hypothetical protein